MSTAPLVDALGRTMRYLRLSVTDRCNFRCLYCQSSARQTFIPHDDILHYEEFLRLVEILTGLGITKVRLTGGEPFARKGCADFLAALRRRFPTLDLRITSNGSLLEDYVPLLKELRVGCVNLSLDTFDPDTFADITGSALFSKVVRALEALLRAGIPVKLNAVALKGITEHSLDDFLLAARDMAIDVRFIEFMPMGADTLWSLGRFCSVDEIRALCEEKVRLIRVSDVQPTDGPARMYQIADSPGRLGFISPLTNHFCQSCNRLRLTSEGALRLCLFDDHEYPVRSWLREEKASDATIAERVRTLCRTKAVGADLLRAKTKTEVARRSMHGIGG